MAVHSDKIDLTNTSNFVSQMKNPLMIDVIIDTIFEKLPISQLKKCRLVNKHWDTRACHFLKNSWRDLKVIELDKNGENVKFEEATHQARDKGLFCKFKESLENYVEFSNTIFKVYPTKFLQLKHDRQRNVPSGSRPSVETKIEDILSILRVSANSLKQLHLTEMYRSGNIVFPTQNKGSGDLIDFNLPHLEKIIVDLRSMSLDEKVKNYEPIIRLLEEIWKRASKFKSLEINENCYTNFETNMSFLDYLKNSDILVNLKDFGIISKVVLAYNDDDEMITTLMGPKNFMKIIQESNGNAFTNLTSLKLKMDFGLPEYYENEYLDSEFENLIKFLQSLAGKLEFLHLDIGQFKKENLIQITLPNFENLKKFSAGNVGTSDLYYSYSLRTIPFTLDLNTNFPVLKSLELALKLPVDFDFESWDTLFIGTSDTVEVLRIESEFSEKMHFKALERKFPNVRQFQTSEINGIFEKEGENPWEDTLEVFTVIVGFWPFKNLDFKLFRPYKVLQRIEIFKSFRREEALDEYNHNRSSSLSLYHRLEYDLESLLELKIKSLKIHHFLLSEENAAKISEKFILDYTLCAKCKPIISGSEAANHPATIKEKD